MCSCIPRKLLSYNLFYTFIFQLGLPLKSVRTVPSDATIEFEQKMNTDALASLMEEDNVANKSPFLVLADTGLCIYSLSTF